MDRRPRQAGRAQPGRRRHRPQGPDPGQSALSPGRVPRLPRTLRATPRGRPRRPGPVRRHGDPLPRLGQPPTIPDTRLTEPVVGAGRPGRYGGPVRVPASLAGKPSRTDRSPKRSRCLTQAPARTTDPAPVALATGRCKHAAAPSPLVAGELHADPEVLID